MFITNWAYMFLFYYKWSLYLITKPKVKLTVAHSVIWKIKNLKISQFEVL